MIRVLAALLVVAGLWLGSQRAQTALLKERATWAKVEKHKNFYRFFGPLVGRQLMADINWSRALIYYADSQDEEGSDFRYLEPFLDNVIALDPGFRRPYRWAAYAVTYRHGQATQDEYWTSLKYLELAMKRFPDKYEYFWLTGLRYWLDLKSDDPAEQRRYREIGADLIERAMRKPDASPMLPTLAATLRTQLGQKERARQDLIEMYLTTDSQLARKRIYARLRHLLDRPEDVEELDAFRKRFQEAWLETLPYASPTMFVLIGPEPSAVVDFDLLATERDLFGADTLDFGQLFGN